MLEEKEKAGYDTLATHTFNTLTTVISFIQQQYQQKKGTE
jgi:hypothetical protein